MSALPQAIDKDVALAALGSVENKKKAGMTDKQGTVLDATIMCCCIAGSIDECQQQSPRRRIRWYQCARQDKQRGPRRTGTKSESIL